MHYRRASRYARVREISASIWLLCRLAVVACLAIWSFVSTEFEENDYISATVAVALALLTCSIAVLSLLFKAFSA
jgi:hypothetical protein